MTVWWHGSPTRIALGDFLIPGIKLDIDRYTMNRNRAVFVTMDRQCAIYYGNTESTIRPAGVGPVFFAPYLYEVRPIYMYPKDARKSPHSHLVSSERQCRKAEVLCRWRCVDTSGTSKVVDSDGSVTLRWLSRDEAVYEQMDDE